MVHGIIRFTIFLGLTAFAAAEVDFTPHESFYLAEATRVANVAFHKGTEEVTYSPPGKWTLSGGGRKLTLTPPDAVQASAIMQTDKMGELLPATEANFKAYADLAVRQLPREATKVIVSDTAICPLRLSQRTMVEVTLTYALYGQQFTTNILFLPYDQEQLSFQITARSADFAPLARAFRASLYSLQG